MWVACMQSLICQISTEFMQSDCSGIWICSQIENIQISQTHHNRYLVQLFVAGFCLNSTPQDPVLHKEGLSAFFFYLLKSIYYSEPCLKQLENFIWQFHPLRKKPNPQTRGRISSWNIPAKWINICLNEYLQQETRGNADTRGTFLEYTNLSIFHPKCTVTSLLFRS